MSIRVSKIELQVSVGCEVDRREGDISEEARPGTLETIPRRCRLSKVTTLLIENKYMTVTVSR